MRIGTVVEPIVCDNAHADEFIRPLLIVSTYIKVHVTKEQLLGFL